VERNRVVLRVNFIYGYCRRGEKIKKESDGNIVREEMGRKTGIIVSGTRDDGPDFGQIETIRTNEIESGGRGVMR